MLCLPRNIFDKERRSIVKRYIFILLIMSLALFVAGASASPPPAWAGGSQTFTDLAGRQVTVSGHPQRIICLGPGCLRLIVYLGAHGSLCGIEDMEPRFPLGRPYYMAQPRMGRLPVVTPGGVGGINQMPDLEGVLKVKPQLIFVTYMQAAKADELAARLSVPVVVLSYGPLGNFARDQVFASLRLAGAILGREKRAQEVVSYIDKTQADLAARTRQGGKPPKAYVGGLGFRGAHGLESSDSRYLPFMWLGIPNLAKGPGQGSHVFMNKESLLILDPEVIFIDGGGLALVTADHAKRPEYYRNLAAFQKGRVHVLHPFNWYTTNVGTALADAYAIGKLILPQGFHQVDPAAKADEIYTFLVGKPVHAGMARQYGPLGGRPKFLTGVK